MAIRVLSGLKAWHMKKLLMLLYLLSSLLVTACAQTVDQSRDSRKLSYSRKMEFLNMLHVRRLERRCG